LYGSLGYRHDFEREFMGVSVQPGETIEYSYGVGFAVSDDISLVSEFFGAFQTRYRIDGTYPHSTSLEPMGLRLSLIRRLCPTARVQPFVVFGLNTDAPDVSFGFLYTRDVKNKCAPQPGGGSSDAR
jgi:hypothetical protein